MKTLSNKELQLAVGTIAARVAMKGPKAASQLSVVEMVLARIEAALAAEKV